MRKKSNRTFGENKPKQSQLPLAISPKTCAWGNYPLRCLKRLPANLTRTPFKGERKERKIRLHYQKRLDYNKVNKFSGRVENIQMVNISLDGLI